MPAEASGISTERLAWWHDRILAALACMLCVSAQVKFAEIQLLELVYAADMVLVGFYFLTHPQPIQIFRPILQLFGRWTAFSLLCVALALVALRSDFYVPPNASFLKQPFVVTLSRIGELALDVYAMVYLACRCREDAALCRFAMLMYYWVGLAGCIYGWLSLAVLTLGGVHSRMVGFNNEGGPFGVYLVSVLAVALALFQKRWIARRQLVLASILILFSMLASESKAALLEIVVFAALIAFLKMKPMKAGLTAVGVVLAGALVFQTMGLTERSLEYVRFSAQYRTVSQLSPENYNNVAGRVAGIYLAPKMIAAHPWAGIGLGNYPIVRNDPQYRQGSAIVNLTLDAPALGAVDYIVDLGFPAFLFLTAIQVAPAIMLLRQKAFVGAVAMVLVLPISIWFGAHLNLTYIWLCVAFGYAVFYLDHDASGRPLSPARVLEAT